MNLFAKVDRKKFVLSVEHEEIKNKRICEEYFQGSTQGVTELVNRARELNAKKMKFSNDFYHPEDYPEIPVQAFNKFLDYMEY